MISTRWPKGVAYFLIFSALGMRLASTPTANLSYFAIAAYALLGRTQAIQALALSWLFSMLNSDIAAEATFAAVGRYAVVACAAASVILHRQPAGEAVRVSAMTPATLMLGVLLVVHSIVVSPIADVSILKAVSWAMVTATLFAAWGSLDAAARKNLATQVFGGLVAVLLCSLPLLAMPQGYMVNGSGFQGILNHPQGFGPVMALLGAWAGARMLAAPRPSWWLMLLVGACLVLVVLSEARTGGIAMVLGLAGAVALTPLLAKQPLRAMLPGVGSRRVHLLVAVAVLGLLVSGSMLSDRMGEYMNKRGEGVSSLGQAYQSSRGELIENMTDNIEDNPIMGIGFGIGSFPHEMLVLRDPLLGLPISAAIEKGVLPIALVEELGLLGSAFVFIWLGLLVVLAGRAGVTALALVLTTLILNLGESTFFSPSGLGLLPLILIAWAATAEPMQKPGVTDA